MVSSGTGKLGRGGMATKLLAARRAAVSGEESDNLRKLFAGEQVGTLLWAGDKE